MLGRRHWLFLQYILEKRLLFDLIVEFIGSACEFDAEKCALSARVASFWSDIEELWFLAGKGRWELVIECLYPSALDSLKKASWIRAASLAGNGKKKLANKRLLVFWKYLQKQNRSWNRS